MSGFWSSAIVEAKREGALFWSALAIVTLADFIATGGVWAFSIGLFCAWVGAEEWAGMRVAWQADKRYLIGEVQ